MARTIPNIASCVFHVQQVDDRIQIFPAGEFRAIDGRPREVDAWHLDDQSAARLIAALETRKANVVIDYEHQTLFAEDNGQPAPAAGWIDPGRFSWVPGKGLFASVRWTERASDYIDAGEYQYISPVFSYDPKSGEVLALLHLALTNNPALDGMDAVSRQAAARADINQPPQELKMNDELQKILGLDEGAEEDAAVAAVKALQQQLADKDQAIAAAKAQTPDPGQFAPIAVVEQLQGELAALKTQADQREIDEMIDIGLSDGRLLPAMESWARDLAGSHGVAALRTYMDKVQPIAALKGNQSGGKPPADEAPALDESELAICTALGLSVETYQKSKAEEVA